MNPLRQSLTRRTTLRLIGGGVAGAALAPVATAARALGIPLAAPLAAGTAIAVETTVVPWGGAGLFDVDPLQGTLSQDPTVVIRGDITALPAGMEL